MIVALLYVIGLLAVLVAIATIGFQVPTIISAYNAATDGGATLIDAANAQFVALHGPLSTFLVGLLLMGAARAIMLLSSIDRSLRNV